MALLLINIRLNYEDQSCDSVAWRRFHFAPAGIMKLYSHANMLVVVELSSKRLIPLSYSSPYTDKHEEKRRLQPLVRQICVVVMG